jgi:AcrR family transcriptional regulator
VRADARDNRARILAAADQVFGAGGPAASTEEVARLAGVGIGTVFRHFPTKQELLLAVLADRLEQLRDRARALAGAPDAGQAFRSFFTEVIAGAATKLAIAGAVPDDAVEDQAVTRAGEDLRHAFGVLLERAQEAGAVRRDVAAPEVYGLMVGISQATTSALADPVLRDKAIAIAFDGLRPV